MTENRRILEIKDLKVEYKVEKKVVNALNGVDLEIFEGETLGLVGETGSGKTTTAMSIMQLIPSPPGKIVGGAINFLGEDLMKVPESRKREIRGNEISMIFQDPMTALNPRMTVGDQIEEVISYHRKISSQEAKKEAQRMLEIVGINKERSVNYPHEFSGGMKQRVVIAIALACQPKLLIADEPTTALDVTIQAQMLKMIQELKVEYQTSVLMITHDLGVVAKTCDKVAIMYAGEIVEYGTLRDIFKDTKHPYTQGLFDSIPSISSKVSRLTPIMGEAPDPSNLPIGCKFSPRCTRCQDICIKEDPKANKNSEHHQFRCHFPLNK